MNKDKTKASGGPCSFRCCRNMKTTAKAKALNSRILRRRAKTATAKIELE